MKKVTFENLSKKEMKKLIDMSATENISKLKPKKVLFEVKEEEEEEQTINLRSNESKHETNPFIEDTSGMTLDIKTRKKKTIVMGNEDVVYVESGEVKNSGGHFLYRTQEVDEEKFAKVYIGGMAQLYGLTKSGIKAFHYIISELKPNNDKVYIYLPDLLKFSQWTSNKQGYQALKELVKAGIIALSTRPGYWFINPAIVFNGDRLLFVQEYKKKKNDNQLILPFNEEVEK